MLKLAQAIVNSIGGAGLIEDVPFLLGNLTKEQKY
jgi:hypothetical protein